MRTIEIIFDVAENGQASPWVPAEVVPGRYRAIVLIGEELRTGASSPDLDFPLHDVGSWPEGLSLSREDM